MDGKIEQNQWLRRLFQKCWHCHLSTWTEFTFCEECKGKFNQLKEFYVVRDYRLINGIAIYSLVEFRRGLEEKLIYSLKGADCHFANFDWVAALLIEKMIYYGLNLDQVIWVTPDSKHSIEIVNSINKITGLSADIIVLTEPGTGSQLKKQKVKNRHERQSKSFITPRTLVNFQKSYIFIDDVVATGNTANAAKIALGSPVQFQAWCLCYRPRLAEDHIV